MIKLRELQRTFCQDIYRDQSRLAEHVVSGQGLDGTQRLAIYRESVFGVLRKALADIYPVVQRLVGERFFTYLANTYIREHPSTAGDLHRYGEQLAGFIRDFAPAAELVYLPDIARLEWSVHCVFHAAEQPGVELTEFQAMDDAQRRGLRFALHPAARLLRSAYPVHHIWQTNAVHVKDPKTIDLRAGAVRLLIYRPQFDVELQPLDAAEYRLLSELAGGQRLQVACESVLAAHTGFDVVPCLFRHVTQGSLIHSRNRP